MFGLFSKSKKPAGKKGNTTAKNKNAAKKPAATKPDTVKQAAVAEEPPQLRIPTNNTDALSEAQAKLDMAKARLDNANFNRGAAPTERKKLIEQALAVHKIQAKLLDDLDEDTKLKLRTLAMEKMFLNKPDN